MNDESRHIKEFRLDLRQRLRDLEHIQFQMFIPVPWPLTLSTNSYNITPISFVWRFNMPSSNMPNYHAHIDNNNIRHHKLDS